MTNPALPSLQISNLTAHETRKALPELIALLQDAVHSGASVGFLPPLSEEEARGYWQGVIQDVEADVTILLVAREEGKIVGSVQLALATKANGSHRAEVQKLFVLQSQRRRGTGAALMLAIEPIARARQRSLLVLDTRQGDNAERLYRRLGYIEAGIIPEFARSAQGTLDATVLFYKKLPLE